MSRKTVKRKTNIALSVDVSLNLHESKSTNQNRVCRKRKQFTKSQYSYSESDISEAEFDQSCCRGKPKSYKKKMYTEYPQKKHERQLMRPWLVEQVNKGDIPGLEWLNKDKTLIKIPWTHASRHGWDETRDSDLFRKWAQNTGKYSSDPKDKNEDGNPKKWKANFRCGMNSLPDIREEKNMSQKKGSDAYKVYRLLPEKVRGQPRKRCNTAQSESSDSDHHYKKYVTKADRLERHKSVVVKEKIKQKIEMRKQTVKAENESLFCRSTANHYDTKPQIPLPVCTTSTNATQPYYEPQQYHSYTSSDSEERSPHQVQQMAQPLNLQTTNATNRPRYTSTQSVDREIEVTTTFEPEFISRMNDYHEHSYALNRSDNTIPSLVQDFETEPDSDYGSTSPSSSPGSQEERIAQPPMHISQDITPRNNIATLWDVYSGCHKCISDLETTYSSNNATDLFSPTTPSMNQEPMFGCHFNPAHSDPRNSIYKRSESMELYSVPGTTFDQSFPMTGDMPTGTPIQMDTDPTSDRPLQFSEY